MFKKPNILRRRVKPSLLNTNPKPCVEEIHIVYTTTEEPSATVKSTLASKHKCSKANHKSRIPAQRIMLDSYICNEYRKRKMQNCNLVEDTSQAPSYKSDVIMLGPEDCPRLQVGRVESADLSQYWTSSGEPHILSHNITTETKYHINQKNHTANENTTEVLATQYTTLASNTKTCSNVTTSSTKSTVTKEHPVSGDCSSVMEEIDSPEQSVLSKWACSQLLCTQTFNSYASLAEHMLTHSMEELLQDIQEDLTDKVKQPPKEDVGSYSCPARLSSEVKRCPQVFCERSQLHTHIRDEHTLDDAPFKCEICGRGFFWWKGLRAHDRSHASSSGGSTGPRTYACVWPGCSRVFTQACRLREHSRAHTGDKPYPCTFPKCGWSFRTASKLQRHARGHTGERRHACTECGRGFLRAEHLREHLPRHAPARPPMHHCSYPGCEQKFSNKSSLYGHQKRHAADETQANVQTTEEIQIVSPSFMVHIGDILASTSINPASEREFHAARTHCPWPLSRDCVAGRPGLWDESQGLVTPEERCVTPKEEYVTPADSCLLASAESPVPLQIRICQLSEHTESMDGVENNEFAVQKDLFLHENPMQHDESQTGGVPCEESMDGMSCNAIQLDHHLGLLDSPPDLHITHLLHEELLYNDVSTDETSFQVLLLSETP